jgi:hypothetical protein
VVTDGSVDTRGNQGSQADFTKAVELNAGARKINEAKGDSREIGAIQGADAQEYTGQRWHGDSLQRDPLGRDSVDAEFLPTPEEAAYCAGCEKEHGAARRGCGDWILG